VAATGSGPVVRPLLTVTAGTVSSMATMWAGKHVPVVPAVRMLSTHLAELIEEEQGPRADCHAMGVVLLALTAMAWRRDMAVVLPDVQAIVDTVAARCAVVGTIATQCNDLRRVLATSFGVGAGK
jgi:hypothetical protein